MRKIAGIALSLCLAASSAEAGGVLSVMLGSGRSFVPVNHTYTSGSGNETIPNGAIQVVITVDGAGGGGACLNAGGNGGLSIKTLAISPSDWGLNLTYLVGTGGSGGSTTNGGTDGTASTSTGTIAAGSFSLAGNGGGHGRTAGAGTPGTASGGDTNTTGGGASGGAGGGDCSTPITGSPGTSGQVIFQYT